MTSITQDSKSFSKRQLLFIRFLTAVLIDLTVLNLFNEYWDNVIINSFTISLLAAVVLQVMLQITFKIEHKVGSHFKSKEKKGLQIFSVWAILFGSKFIILWVLEMLFGENIMFKGNLHGMLAFIIVIITMVAAGAILQWITNIVLSTK